MYGGLNNQQTVAHFMTRDLDKVCTRRCQEARCSLLTTQRCRSLPSAECSDIKKRYVVTFHRKKIVVVLVLTGGAP